MNEFTKWGTVGQESNGHWRVQYQLSPSGPIVREEHTYHSAESACLRLAEVLGPTTDH